MHPEVVQRRYEDFVFSHGDPVADPNFGDGMQEQQPSLEELVEELVDGFDPCDDPDDSDAEKRSVISDDSSIDPEGQRRDGDSTPILPERAPRVDNLPQRPGFVEAALQGIAVGGQNVAPERRTRLLFTCDMLQRYDPPLADGVKTRRWSTMSCKDDEDDYASMLSQAVMRALCWLILIDPIDTNKKKTNDK